jgi:hypothetical protein
MRVSTFTREDEFTEDIITLAAATRIKVPRICKGRNVQACERCKYG